MQVTIAAIKRTDRVSKAGKSFVSLGLKTKEYADKWLSGFGGDENSHWKVGDVVEIELETKGEYLNFKTKKVNPVSQAPSDSRAGNLIEFKVLPALDRILARQGLIMKALEIKVDETGYPQMDETNDSHGLEYPDVQLNTDDMPF